MHHLNRLFALLAIILVFASCSQQALRPPLPEDVQAISAGTISRHDPIRIEFARPLGSAGTEIPVSPVFMDPPVAGKAQWALDHVLEFVPASPLTPGQSYRVSVDLGQGVGLPAPFDFMVHVPSPVLELSMDAPRLHRDKNGPVASIEGVVRSNDRQDPDLVAKALTVSVPGRDAHIEWDHDADGRSHRFRLKGMERSDSSYMVSVSWSNSPLGGSGGGRLETKIPGLGEFNLMSAQVRTEPQYCVELVFSDLLDPSQDLRGLVRLNGSPVPRYELDDNKLRLFPDKPLAQAASLQVEPELRNEARRSMGIPVVETVAAITQLPEVRFLGKGVIVPDSQGLVIPIETMNLTAVTIQAFRIYGDNMGQFLQVNELEGTRELYRVGKEVWRKVVNIPWTASMANTWVRTGLDLSQLQKAHPGGMLRIQVSFGPGNTVYPGASSLPEARTTSFQDVIGSKKEGDSSYWDYWEDERNDYYENYNNRMNPAHKAYYMPFGDHNIASARNFLFSNLGIMAKKGEDKVWHLAVTDLRDAKPVKAAKVVLQDFVNQELARGETDSNGLVRLSSPEEPFLVKVETTGTDPQHGWLKLSPAQLLSVSSFDVSGVKPDAGVRGFIYGERGVWRPGDDIYLTFILFDPLKALPAGHPVTLEFLDPQNSVVETRSLAAAGTSNFYATTLSTDPDDQTGDWTARVMVGNSVFTKTIKVETVKPNRLKIDLKFAGNPAYLSGTGVSGTMAGAWLHGAPAPGLKADLGVRFSPVPTTFGSWTDYTFDDPSRTVVPESQVLFSLKLDANASSTFNAGIKVNTRPSGLLRADFMGRIYEDEGTWSAEQFSMPYHYYQNYVGLKLPKGDEARGMLLTDVDHPAQIVMVDRDGKPVSGTVDVELFKLDWRWWWEKGEDNLAQFTEAPASRRIMAGTVEVRNGRAEWPFQVKYPDWGRYMVRVQDRSGKHSAARVVYMDWPGWAGRAQADGQGSAQVMTLNTDKTSYLTGEKVTVTFPSNKEGRALVSIEAKGRIIDQQWIGTQDGTTRWQFVARPDMSPNCYVHVSFLQPHLQTKNDLPMRLYGIVPVMVKDPATELAPTLNVADKLLPNSKVKVTVSEAQGKAMTYTLAMVDEGLLGLTRHKVQNPWSTFYSREASRIQSWDLYHLVAGAFGAKLATLLAVGGSDDGMGDAGQKPERFKPIVQFVGPFTLQAGQVMTHELEIPNYLGAVRFMVVGGTATAFGAIEKSAVVKSPLAAQTTLPRVLGAGETVDVPVRVFVEDPSASGTVSLKLSVGGGISIEGPASRDIDLGGALEGSTTFRLKVGDTIGAASVKLEASAGTLSATESTELYIRPLGVEVTRVTERMLKPGEKINEMVVLPGVSPGNSLKFELSTLPPIDLARSLQYLITYPYGCVEQTTSSVFPQLYLDQVTTLAPAESAAIGKNVSAGIERLRQFQIPSGAFAYWPGEQNADLWATNYAGHFLLEAKKRGFSLPPGMLEKWYEFQKTNANSFNSRDTQAMLNQAYRLYTLALHGKPDLAAMNRLKEVPTLPTMARWRLAASYLLAGQPTAAAAFFQLGMLEFKAYRELDGTYGSDTRDRAIALETLMLLKQWKLAEPLYQEISKSLSSGQVHSTQTTAYALIALLPMAREQSGTDTSYVWQWNTAAPRPEKTKKAYNTHSIDLGTATRGTLSLQNSGQGPLYLRIMASGTPLRDNTPAMANGLKLELQYLDAEGSTVNPALAVPGEEILVRALVTNTSGRPLKNCALKHLLPGAWEVVNTRLAGEVAAPGTPGLDYQDIRDDRVYSFFSLKAGETRQIDIRVTRSFGGRFWLPAVKAEVMYDPALMAVVPGRWLE